VSDSQNCGNILAGVGPWSIEHGSGAHRGRIHAVRIHMLNTGSIAVAHVPTPHGRWKYEGDARIDGVPGSAAAIPIDFLDVADPRAARCFRPERTWTASQVLEVTCIDNGMPVVLMRAADLGKRGDESPEAA